MKEIYQSVDLCAGVEVGGSIQIVGTSPAPATCLLSANSCPLHSHSTGWAESQPVAPGNCSHWDIDLTGPRISK